MNFPRFRSVICIRCSYVLKIKREYFIWRVRWFIGAGDRVKERKSGMENGQRGGNSAGGCTGKVLCLEKHFYGRKSDRFSIMQLRVSPIFRFIRARNYFFSPITNAWMSVVWCMINLFFLLRHFFHIIHILSWFITICTERFLLVYTSLKLIYKPFLNRRDDVLFFTKINWISHGRSILT